MEIGFLELQGKTDILSPKKQRDFGRLQSPKNPLRKPWFFSFRRDSEQNKLLDPFVSRPSMQQCDPGVSTPFTNDEDRTFYELEQALQYPVLPPSPHFFCCFERFHITSVAKVLSLVYLVLYGLLCFISYKSDHAVAFLISLLVAISVAASTIFATFSWTKSCLIPFFLLQVMLILYTAVWMVLLTYAALNPGDSYVFSELYVVFENWLGICTQLWCWLLLAIFTTFMCFLFYSSLIFFYEYQFLAEVDRFLKSIKKSSSNVSKENHDTQNNGAASRLQL